MASRKNQSAPGNRHSQSSSRVAGPNPRTAKSGGTEKWAVAEEHKLGKAGSCPATG